ncbi:MAG: hypothetical protein HYX44_03760 [Aquabacterium sp.]|nr:hypothetical protein [Aquabacterium sp.]
MIARPVTRPRPIPYAEQPAGGKPTRPVSWAAAAGPALPSSPVEASAARPSPQLLVPPPPPRRSPVRVATLDGRQAATPASHTTPSGELQARFTGHGALSVRSSVTGRHYRFQGHGDCQTIDKHDMMMLRRIPDLVIS